MDFLLHCILHLLMLPPCAQESGSLQRIRHKNYETAVLGRNVTLFCNFSSLANVLQITWQKIQGSLPHNIGTYSHTYGEKILPPYVNRLQCKTLEPSASFMTIQGVTFEDEACYKCLFNIFPRGSHGGQTCLTILTVSELVTELQSAPGSEDLHSLLCSAVGKPAPGISIYPSQVTVQAPQEYFVQNANATVTVTKIYNISLKTARSLGLQNLVVSMTHPVRNEEKIVHLPVNQGGTTNPCLNWMITAIAFIILFFVSCIISAVLYIYFQKKRSEKVPKPSPTQDPYKTSTLMPPPPSTESENLITHTTRQILEEKILCSEIPPN
ncbi:OX-2 membrane glycoprotein isoform X2 [Mus musculus]|uniref:OX-2 membrane glycoprotein isoform X2 n=1 Tax=Mus musculus TaxID=10090 RepID=UPI0003D72441|nr:OX-2 membrane glycoprotein isoform X2 [Mus musculus]|eukprot:XP_003085155.2 PREDICTED: OX-2 membrane glycoprotein isoform X2 [Mus musculus]